MTSRRWRAYGNALLGSVATILLGLGLAAPPAAARDLIAVGTHFPRIYEVAAAAPGGSGGAPGGLAVDLLQLLAAQLGHRIRFEVYPWPRAQAMVEQGAADILIGPYRTPEREGRFLFSQLPFYEDPLVFYARRPQQALWSGDLAALQRHEIGVVQGWAYGDELERARPQLHISTARNVETGVLMLKMGRVELLASNERNTAPVIASMGLGEELLPLLPPIAVLRGHFAFPRTPAGAALQQEFDRALAQLRATGEWRELARRWKLKVPD